MQVALTALTPGCIGHLASAMAADPVPWLPPAALGGVDDVVSASGWRATWAVRSEVSHRSCCAGWVRLESAGAGEVALTVFVDPANRRRGVGAATLRAARVQARRAGAVTVVAVCDTANEAGLAALHAAGFTSLAGEPPWREFAAPAR